MQPEPWYDVETNRFLMWDDADSDWTEVDLPWEDQAKILRERLRDVEEIDKNYFLLEEVAQDFVKYGSGFYVGEFKRVLSKLYEK